MAEILSTLGGYESEVLDLAATCAEQETAEEVTKRLTRLRQTRAGLLFTWLEGAAPRLLPMAYWLAYGTHAPSSFPVEMPSWARVVYLRALVRQEAPGLRPMVRQLLEDSPLASAVFEFRHGKSR